MCAVQHNSFGSLIWFTPLPHHRITNFLFSSTVGISNFATDTLLFLVIFIILCHSDILLFFLKLDHYWSQLHFLAIYFPDLIQLSRFLVEQTNPACVKPLSAPKLTNSMEPSLSPLLMHVKTKGLVVKLAYLGHRKPPTSFTWPKFLRHITALNF